MINDPTIFIDPITVVSCRNMLDPSVTQNFAGSCPPGWVPTYSVTVTDSYRRVCWPCIVAALVLFYLVKK